MARIVVVGAGFAGFHATRRLLKGLGPSDEVVLINPRDYFLYVPLLPHVLSGLVEPRRTAVSVPGALRGATFVAGQVTEIDLDAKAVRYEAHEGGPRFLPYDHVIITSGSVTNLLPIPGVAENALGFRGLTEAVFLRDHVIRQVELADQTDDPAERTARLTFVVVGAGYTGTEVAAHGARLTRRLLKRHPRLRGVEVRWLLLDTADRVLPGLKERLGRTAASTLRRLGVDVQLQTSVDEATHDGVKLTNGTKMSTRSLIWCVGVRPDPLVTSLGLKTQKGRLEVNPDLSVPGHPTAWACGDSAAVPDLTRPGEVTTMTAQHAQRQGERVGRNVLAALAGRQSTPYKHRNLGFVVDLGGASAAADPLGVPLAGFPAAVVTRGYHLSAMPGNRLRTVLDWIAHAGQGPQEVQLDLAERPQLQVESKTSR